MIDLAEHVAEVLNVGPGTRVFEVDCGAGDFLYPFQINGYLVGGCDMSANAIQIAAAAMPGGMFQQGTAAALDPAVPFDVVVWRSLASVADEDIIRGIVARMFAKATHAIALLDAPEPRQSWLLRVLVEVGANAIQFEAASAPDRVNAFARV